MTTAGQKIFIGHGYSPVWRELKDLKNSQQNPKQPLDRKSPIQAAFAFLILTAEDEQADGTLRARENVVHVWRKCSIMRSGALSGATWL
jgi:hypothetical protein